MKVSMSENGRNSVVVHVNGESTLFSYCTAIAKTDKDGKVILDKNYWEYSNTTVKHRDDFLGEGIAETIKKIESGEYTFENLN